MIVVELLMSHRTEGMNNFLKVARKLPAVEIMVKNKGKRMFNSFIDNIKKKKQCRTYHVLYCVEVHKMDEKSRPMALP